MKKLLLVLLFILLSLSACGMYDNSGELWAVESAAEFFEQPESRIFDVSYPVGVDGDKCYMVEVLGLLAGGETYLIDYFALNRESGAKYYYNVEAAEFEQFYTVPFFACMDSPNGNWRAESLHICRNGVDGAYTPGEVRIVDLFSGEIWPMCGVQDILSLAPAIPQPGEGNAPVFKLLGWSGDDTVLVSFEWAAQNGEPVGGEYEYNVARREFSISSLDAQ